MTPGHRNDRSWSLIWVWCGNACMGFPASPKHNHDAVPPEEDIWLTEMSAQSTLVDLERKRSEQARRAAPNGDQGASWMKRVGDTLRGGDDCTSVSLRHPTYQCQYILCSVTLEIRGLQILYPLVAISTLQASFIESFTHIPRPNKSLSSEDCSLDTMFSEPLQYVPHINSLNNTHTVDELTLLLG
jgi:hypothetical protein